MATKAEIISEAVAGERLRIMAILQSPEGLKHPRTAINFALNSGMSPDLANSTMAELPVESPFLEAMDTEGAIGIRAAGTGGGVIASDDPKAARLAELTKTMTGFNSLKGYAAPKAAR